MMCTAHARIGALCMALLTFSVFIPAAAAISVVVDSVVGIDDLSCSTTNPCKTIAFASKQRGASVLLLRGVFNESTVYVTSVAYINISGSATGSAALFDCSARAGPAFSIANSTIAISAMTFINCRNRGSRGGAVSATNSSVSLWNCTFANNSAVSGGALSLDLGALVVGACSFVGNAAGCPFFPNVNSTCFAWGGAIAAFETASVDISRSTFVSNSVDFSMLNSTTQLASAVGGGGCISVLFKFNVISTNLNFSGNSFLSCTATGFGNNSGFANSAQQSTFYGVQLVNSFGGAVSVYLGVAAVTILDARNVVINFANNTCKSCNVSLNSGLGGNGYGGCVSLYIGSQSLDALGLAPIATGPLLVTNFQGSIVGNSFANSYAGNAGQSTSGDGSSSGSNVFGGSIAIVIGHYLYSGGTLTGRNAVTGDVRFLNSSIMVNSNTFNGSIAASATYGTGPAGNSYGVNAYGGALSINIGCYSYSYYISQILGSIIVSSANFDISNNVMTGCIVNSSTGKSYPKLQTPNSKP